MSSSNLDADQRTATGVGAGSDFQGNRPESDATSPKQIGPRVRAPHIFASLLALLGVVLSVGGVRLATLGGSLYYLVAGATLIASGVLLWRRQALGARLYALLTLGTVIWAVWESGFDGWALAPRVVPFLVVGGFLLRPGLRRSLEPRGDQSLLRSPFTWIFAVMLSIVVVGVAGHRPYPVLPFPSTAVQTPAQPLTDWQHFGRTLSGTRYAPFDEITPQNVANLQVAWMYRTGVEGGFRATPLQVGNTLYVCLEGNIIQALEADTGKPQWRFDPQIQKARTGPTRTCRGVSYYAAPDANVECPKRVITATIDARLLAVDAATGERCRSFGTNGEVDLLTGLGEVKPGFYYSTSPPTITRGVAVVGAWVSDGVEVGEPSGVIRAFDAVTGKLRWAWDSARPEPITELHEGEIFTRGTPNSWSIFSADEQLGLVYIPTGNATPDYFGAHRSKELEKYASSVVALEADTGRVRWSFQTVHHDIWDYDVPSQPVLIDLPQEDGSTVPALVAPTKRNELFLLDRRTGKPLAPVEERAVPQTDVPEEWTSKTQPFSVGMPSFGRDFITEAKMWGLTPIDQMMCRIEYRKLRYEGPLTPPSVRGTIESPGFAGGMNWGSASVDEEHDVMIVNMLNIPGRIQLIPRASFNGAGDLFILPQAGTPYAVRSVPFFSPLFTPCVQPPYGEIAAVDLRSKQTLWRRPLGSANELGPLGLKSHLPITMGVINIGGTLTTKSGLVFMGGTLDRRLRAFDIRNGDVLWTATLPNSGHATPMSYISPNTHRQYVVMTVPSADPMAALSPHAAKPAEPELKLPPGEAGGWIIAYSLPGERH